VPSKNETIKMNWDEVDVLVPPGLYTFGVVSAIPSVRNNTHTISAQFEIVECSSPNAKEVGNCVVETFIFDQAHGFRVKNFAAQTGVELPTVLNGKTINLFADSLLGVVVRATVVVKDFKGKERSYIDRYPLDVRKKSGQPAQKATPSTAGPVSVGLTVCLKSGGPTMTVLSSTDENVTCGWLSKAGAYSSATFPHAALMEAPK
jgi:uncharacterized protein YodC (DUF2158 family)